MDRFQEVGRTLRFAIRGLRREPGFAAAVVATCALAVGTNAAMFGLVSRLMLAPPPGIRDAERVVRVDATFFTDDGEAYSLATTSYPGFLAVAAVDDAFSGVAAVRTDTMTVGRGADVVEVAAVQASGEYFAVLGARPALGRFFGAADDELPVGTDVVVLSHRYWRRHFGGRPDALGRQLIVDDRPLTIVGVAGRGFNGTGLASTDLFVPFTTAMRSREAGWWNVPGMRLIAVIARLRDGVSPAAAVDMLRPALADGAFGSSGDHLSAARLESLGPGRTSRGSPQARIALWLWGVSGVVLLIATANVATLLLLRGAKRRRDVAIRAALGAGRPRLVRQSLIESLVLAMGGAAAGLLLARWFDDLIRATLLPNLSSGDRVLDTRVLIVSVAVAGGIGLVAGLAPVVRIGHADVAAELRAGAGHGASGRFLLHRALVAVQVALCTVLLIGAGLFVRSLQRVQSQDLGFSTARLLHITLDFRGRLAGRARDTAHVEAARRLASLADVTGVTVVQGMPFASHHIPPISIPGYDRPPTAGGQLPIMYGATPTYLDLMDVELVEGRLITDRDAAGAPFVVLVNETMARTVWPGARAIGKCVRAGHPPTFGGEPGAGANLLPCREVVGVVRDSRARSLRPDGHEAKLMQYYVPFGQLPSPPFADVPAVHGILVRTANDASRSVGAVQRAIHASSETPVYAQVRPYQDLIDPQLRPWRLGATLFSAFGMLALGIAAMGLFATVSYLVAQRTPEIGVRLALGGTGRRIARLVVADTLRMAAAGAVAGLLIALASAPLVQSMLFQTSARESTIVAAAVAVLFGVTLAAAALPAWRASRVSPMTVLRTE